MRDAPDDLLKILLDIAQPSPEGGIRENPGNPQRTYS
jgi:hypothetical protein